MTELHRVPVGPVVPETPYGERPNVSAWAYANVLLRRLRLVLGLPIAAAIIVGVISLLTARQYVASASFMPQEPTTPQLGLSQLASQFGLSLPQASTISPQFYGDLLQSREILRAVVLTQYGDSAPDTAESKFRGNLIEYFRIRSQPADRALMLAMDALRRILFVRTDRNTGIVHFDVVTRYPELSAGVARRFLDLVSDFNLKRRQSQGRAEREFTEQQLAVAKDSLAAAEEALADFYKRNRRFQDSPELVAQEARLQRQVTVRQQLYLTLSQSHAAAKIEEVRNTPVITMIERPEGFVTRQPRGAMRKVLLAWFGAGALAVALAFAVEYAERAQEAASPEYQEFLDRSRQFLGRVRRRGSGARGGQPGAPEAGR